MPNYKTPASEFVDFKTTKIPPEVLNTGDTTIIQNCLNTHNTLTENDKAVLNGRLDAMNYVNALAAEQNNSKYLPPQVYQTEGGVLLPQMEQQTQSSACGCWAMPLQLMLQSRNIQVPQSVIRDFRPVISGPESAQLGDAHSRQLNTDTYSNVAWGAELLQRLLPNTIMNQRAYGSDSLPMTDEAIQSYKADMKRVVTSALSNSGSPVALLYEGHYRTIVGIDGDDLIVKDSLNSPVTDARLSLDQVFRQARKSDTKAVEISWINDLPTEKGAVQTDFISQALPFLARKGDTLSIDPEVYNTMTAGADNPYSNYSYEEQGVFRNTLNVQHVRGENGQYIRESVILPKTLHPNVRELEPMEAAQEVIPGAEDSVTEEFADSYSPEEVAATLDDFVDGSINDPEMSDPVEYETDPDPFVEEASPEEKQVSDLEPIEEVDEAEEDEPEEQAEKEKATTADKELGELNEMLSDLGMPTISENGKSSEAQALDAMLADLNAPVSETSQTSAAEGAKTFTKKQAEAFVQQLSDEYLSKDGEAPDDLSFLNEDAKENAPAEVEQETFELLSYPEEEKPEAVDDVKTAPEQPKTPTQPTAPVQPMAQKKPTPAAPTMQQPMADPDPDPDAMLDDEISKYSIPSSSYNPKFVAVDMYPPKPSMLKELCKAFGIGLLGAVRGIPILGSIVGFFADVVTNAVRSYDRMMQQLDAQKPFMAGSDVYNMAILGVIKQGKKDPSTAAVFGDPRFQKAMKQLAVNDPDLNYAATHEHSPEFYKKYLMDQKGFNKLSANYMKNINKTIFNWKDITKKYETNVREKKAIKVKQSAQKQKTQPNIKNPSMGPY